MKRRIAILGAALLAAAAIAGGAVALATSDSEGGVTGAQADRAVKAALEATGGGTANEVELDSEDGATWEVEVTKPNGVTVDVRLDENFEVMLIEVDSEEPGGEDEDEHEDEDDGNEDEDR